MDRVILAEDCFQEGGIGTERPNDNQIIVGGTGCGKTMSCLLPTVLNTSDSSMIATFSKPEEIRRLTPYLRQKGYETQIIDLINPERSTVFYDPIKYLKTELDIRNLANAVIEPDADRTRIDPYWVNGARSLLTAVISAQLFSMGKEAKMTEALHMLDTMIVYSDSDQRSRMAYRRTASFREASDASVTIWDDPNLRNTANAAFHRLAEKYGEDWPPYRKFRDFEKLPDRTGACMLNEVQVDVCEFFPSEITEAMDALHTIDFKEIGRKKTALFIITSPVNTATYAFANLIMQTAIKELLESSLKRPGGRLAIPVKLLFDDFACGAPIHDFAKQISIFRVAGISVMILLQSESQLAGLYGARDAATIVNNCATYVYFFGGRDVGTCRNLSELTNMTVDQIANAPVGKVLAMLPGKPPVVLPRYNVYSSREYREYMAFAEKSEGKTVSRSTAQYLSAQTTHDDSAMR